MVLEEKQELNFEKLKDMIEEKKRKVGAGYLTDQGALFLVAADIGVSLDKANKIDSNIKDLFIGARDISISGRILSIHPITTYLQRDSNQETKNRIIIIYDKESSIKIKLWDDHADIPEQLGLATGDIIKISKGQVKSAMDGKPIVNLSGNGTIEIITEEKNHNIPSIEEITTTIEELDTPKENLVITGSIKSNPRLSEFTNIRGEHSKSLQCEVANDENNRQIRTIIWNITENKIPKSLTTNLKIELNENDILECFPTRVLGNTIEISSQDSYIHILNEDKDIPLSTSLESKIKDIELSNKIFFIEAIILQPPNTMEINTKAGETISVTDTIIGDDTGEIRLVAWRDSSNLLKGFNIGERVKIKSAFATTNKEGKIELTLKPYSSITKIS